MTRESGAFLDGYRDDVGLGGMQHGQSRRKVSPEAAERRRLKDEAKVKKYRALSARILADKDAGKYNEKDFELTAKMLETNPEFYTVWNYRKDILTEFKLVGLQKEERHQLLAGELQFVLAQLQRFPKCYWIWNHRKWCLLQDTLADWGREMKLVGMFFQADPRNFHAWAYRRWVVQCIEEAKPTDDERAAVDWDEFNFTTKMINHDISNYSAWHNRSALVKRMFERPPPPPLATTSTAGDDYLEAFRAGSKKRFLQLELTMFQTAIYTDPDDSSVWIYAQWLFSEYFLQNLQQEEAVKFISETLGTIEELGALEKEDNDGKDNQWCLKAKLHLLKQLHKYNSDSEVNAFNETRLRLEELDPMRAQRYKDLAL